MSLSGFQKLTKRASAYWTHQFLNDQSKDRDASTNDGSHILQQTILDISAQKAQEYLFPEIQACQQDKNMIEEPEAVQIKQTHQLEIKSYQEDFPSSTSCSQCQKIKKNRGQKTQACNLVEYQGKKRFTNSENALILQQINQGKNYTEIAHQIPGATRNLIKHQIFKKMKLCGQNNEMDTTIKKLDNLLMDENIDKTVKIQELKELISNVEGHLHHTKQLILQKYLYMFQLQS